MAPTHGLVPSFKIEAAHLSRLREDRLSGRKNGMFIGLPHAPRSGEELVGAGAEGDEASGLATPRARGRAPHIRSRAWW